MIRCVNGTCTLEFIALKRMEWNEMKKFIGMFCRCHDTHLYDAIYSANSFYIERRTLHIRDARCKIFLGSLIRSQHLTIVVTELPFWLYKLQQNFNYECKECETSEQRALNTKRRILLLSSVFSLLRASEV